MQPPLDKPDHARQPIWASVLLLSFGLGVLLFLVAIERVNWFHLRPASGVAAAMSYASGHDGDGTAVRSDRRPVETPAG